MQEANKVNEEELDILKIKTICEYLFFDQFKDNASFETFEKCFLPLYNNVKLDNGEYLSIETVFKDICGRKKKYITFKRFAKAYFKHKKGNDDSKHTKLFFDKLLNSILKGAEESVGEDKDEDFFVFTTKKTCRRRKCLTMIQILSDKEGNIHGINLEYDGVYISKMYPYNLEDDLMVNLEMKLDYLNRASLQNNRKMHFTVLQDAYRDGVTHIFGTINKDKNISFIGFKCISGKMVFDGYPDGDGFLFGQYGDKFHDIWIQMTEEGINKIIPGLKSFFTKI